MLRGACCGFMAGVLAFAAPPAARAQTALSPAQIQAIDARYNAQIRAKAVPGVQLGIARRGRILYVKGYGSGTISPPAPVRADSTFLIGSITKQFTAAAVLLLQRDGALAIDDPLSRYIPEYRYASRITLRQILNMVSGVPADTVKAFNVNIETFHELNPGAPFSTEIEIRRLNRLPLDFSPGTKFQYSDAGYWLLGIVIERASHMPYDAFVTRRLFDAVGMPNSYFFQRRHDPREVHGFVRQAGGGFAVKPDLRYAISFAAGAIVSNVSDLLRWDHVIRTKALLTPGDTTTMFAAATLTDGAQTPYAMGWIHAQAFNWHNGGTFGFHSMNGLFPDDYDIVVLGNTSTSAFFPERLAVETYNIANPAHPVSGFGVSP